MALYRVLNCTTEIGFPIEDVCCRRLPTMLHAMLMMMMMIVVVAVNRDDYD